MVESYLRKLVRSHLVQGFSSSFLDKNHVRGTGRRGLGVEIQNEINVDSQAPPRPTEPESPRRGPGDPYS